MKAVLISIQPKYCELIATGKKTIEVRKSKPKIKPPFKCYIYQTKKRSGYLWEYDTAIVTRDGDVVDGSQKVIGEFVCDDIKRYEGEFYDIDDTYEQCIKECYEPKNLEEYEEYEYEMIYSTDQENCYKEVPFLKHSCLTFGDLRRYLGKGLQRFYGWHISDLKIYDVPMELEEFRKPLETIYCSWWKQYCCDRGCISFDNTDYYCRDYWDWKDGITKAPQSWMFVEELK